MVKKRDETTPAPEPAAVVARAVQSWLAEALAGRASRRWPEGLLRMVELVVRGLRGALEETAAELERGSTLRDEINGAAAQLGGVVRRLERAQRLREPQEDTEAR